MGSIAKIQDQIHLILEEIKENEIQVNLLIENNSAEKADSLLAEIEKLNQIKRDLEVQLEEEKKKSEGSNKKPRTGSGEDSEQIYLDKPVFSSISIESDDMDNFLNLFDESLKKIDDHKNDSKKCSFDVLNLEKKRIVSMIYYLSNNGLLDIFKEFILFERKTTNINVNEIKKLKNVISLVMSDLIQLGNLEKDIFLEMEKCFIGGDFHETSIDKFLTSKSKSSQVHIVPYNLLKVIMEWGLNMLSMSESDQILSGSQKISIVKFIDMYKGYYNGVLNNSIKMKDLGLKDTDFTSNSYIQNESYSKLVAFLSEFVVLKPTSTLLEGAKGQDKIEAFVDLRDSDLEVKEKNFYFLKTQVRVPDVNKKLEKVFYRAIDFDKKYSMNFTKINGSYFECFNKLKKANPLQDFMSNVIFPSVSADDEAFNEVVLKILFNAVSETFVTDNNNYVRKVALSLFEQKVDAHKFYHDVINVPVSLRLDPDSEFKQKFRSFFLVMMVRKFMHVFFASELNFKTKDFNIQLISRIVQTYNASFYGAINRGNFVNSSNVVSCVESWVEFLVSKRKNAKNSDEMTDEDGGKEKKVRAIFIGSKAHEEEMKKRNYGFIDYKKYEEKNQLNSAKEVLFNSTIMQKKFDILFIDNEAANVRNLISFLPQVIDSGRDVIVFDSFKRDNVLCEVPRNHILHQHYVGQMEVVDHKNYIISFTVKNKQIAEEKKLSPTQMIKMASRRSSDMLEDYKENVLLFFQSVFHKKTKKVEEFNAKQIEKYIRRALPLNVGAEEIIEIDEEEIGTNEMDEVTFDFF